MIKKLAVKCVAIASALILTLGGVGCNNQGQSQEATYDIWTTYNTMKVIRDVEIDGQNYNENYVKMEKGINVKMAKAESEMGSFYVTTGDVGVKKFNLVEQDLVNEKGDVFPIENMEVYAQRYIEVAWRSRNNNYEQYPVGSYSPDAIVEMDLYRAAGENKIAPNSNQGFTVDFKTTKDTPAGTYRGTFYLVLDNKAIDIPVSVTVWDYAVPEKSTSSSCVLIYEDSIKQGEMTSIASEVDAWYRVYYETALNYRINPYMVPESTKSPTKFVENVVKYYDHPYFTTFGLPHQSFLGKYDGSYDDKYVVGDADKEERYGDCMNYWFDCLYLLGWAAKNNGKNYFEMCYIYPIDEPNNDSQVLVAIEWMEDLKQLKNDVADKLVKDGVFDENDPIIASVRDVDIVCTAEGDQPKLEDYDIVYVPEPYEIEDYSIQTNIENHAEKNNNPIWYYTQIDKIGDGPNLFIDDFMVAGRLQGWVEQYYNIDGWLYWEFNQYLKKIAFRPGYDIANPYEDMSRDQGTATGCAGGGYFVYPASKYGAEEPIKTLRLLTFRDGQEDKETLRYLESLYREFETYYGVSEGTFDVNNVFKGVYDKLFCRSAVYRDDKMFYDCREILKDTVINAQSNENKFIYNMEYAGKMATYSFYTAPGYQVKVGGTVIESTVSGQGLKHTYTMDASKQNALASVELVKNGQSTTIELYEVLTERAVDILDESFEVSVTEGSSFEKTAVGYNFTINSHLLNNNFIPQITIQGCPDSFNVIEVDIENNTNKATKMYLRIVYQNGTGEQKDIGLPANSSRTVEMLCRKRNGKKIKSVCIRFDNRELVEGVMLPVGTRTITVKGMRVR